MMDRGMGRNMGSAECGMRNAELKSLIRYSYFPSPIPHSTLRTPHSPSPIPHSTLRTPHSQHGFTLLEVMVALLIIATSFIVLLHSRNQSVLSADYARHVTISTLLASEKMGEMEQEGSHDTGEDGGDFGEDYPGYTWKTTVSDTAYENIKEVKVEVLWGEGQSKRSVEIVNYVKEKGS